MATPRAENVGVIALDVYFPSRYVDQAELEQHDGVSAGKYTIGLGQSKMAFCDDREDISSVCMTAVQNFMEKFRVSYGDIGRLEVGTETIIDKSKSTKTVLMQLFEESGNFSVEGIDTTNACYGGTSALFNACQWVDSSAWDGRLALVVAGDIAVYDRGPARPSGGCGIVCMLVGPDAPLALEFPLRGTFMEHIYDFYKPNMSSEFPTVDGPLSVTSYVRAVDHAYSAYLDKLEKVAGIANPSLSDIDYLVFHSPYTKQVVKGFARIAYNDFVRAPDAPAFAEVQQFKDETREESYVNKVLEKAFISLSKAEFARKTEPSLLAARNIGNMYTGSVFFGIASLLTQVPSAELQGKRIALFSYGSGCAASTYSFRVRGDTTKIAQTIDLVKRLDSRIQVAPKDFEQIMELREKTHNAQEYEPTGNVDQLAPGTYYLQKIDSMWRRAYGRVPLN
ncbi:3-hydroxy-3-methylglutaryl coenzyme A synthase [Coemansia sp. RSA 2706]|nr:3-hydroxy-3-methylglutaryl coenzyme A synthase [Coemansia sp. RSA 2711]KAJ2297579.1 3-hydroxy-3-methylglutaryl coenzyme A synthase [Coemansia sp. RSA 2706]KAJ2308869.1 3-hydroxy-3-methylglutaryl coenzyme A synthase [Coemansia sp. RSA 2705]KAJ2310995.1 3-hydroxy-3-methylglutaryl coenzyme A synthase [Coemansia sp. RSA 2704]KAJ2360662.1 3-hydroxy-3-methylglutaryl coenzyme A synthase [Coemansia sp. RSA 2610]KAJ2373198.1 3-hydroxy-3-methylglutaryl coenzyme A synthase [Coemansia sp. RSA 2611]KAJ